MHSTVTDLRLFFYCSTHLTASSVGSLLILTGRIRYHFTCIYMITTGLVGTRHGIVVRGLISLSATPCVAGSHASLISTLFDVRLLKHEIMPIPLRMYLIQYYPRRCRTWVAFMGIAIFKTVLVRTESGERPYCECT